MVKLFKKRAKRIGLPPGSMVYTGEEKGKKIGISVIDYSPERVTAQKLSAIEEAFSYKDTKTITWINVNGIHDVQLLKKLGEHYEIHPLVLEDILNTEQRIKIDFHENYIFIVLKVISFEGENGELTVEQVSLILGDHYVITFQEREGDIFKPVRSRINNNKGTIRSSGSDYLAYALIDVIVDHYFWILEKIGERIEDLDGQVLENPDHSVMQEIQTLKKELIVVQKSVLPLRESIRNMMKEESSLIHENIMPYLRDLYDHIIQVGDTVDTYRDINNGIMDLYLSTLSHRMNEVMKVLTIIATIFIPLTFIAGVYGMNFEFMPELQWRWGYPAVWGVMMAVLVGMILYFKRKKWI